MTSPAISELASIDVRDGVAVAVGANGTVIKLGAGAVGIAEAPVYGTVGVYPVPATDRLHLVWAQPADVRVEVIAADGRVVRQERYNGTGPVMDVADLPEGTYALRVQDDRGVRAQGRFIVSR
jgi:hypothetical protein